MDIDNEAPSMTADDHRVALDLEAMRVPELRAILDRLPGKSLNVLAEHGTQTALALVDLVDYLLASRFSVAAEAQDSIFALSPFRSQGQEVRAALGLPWDFDVRNLRTVAREIRRERDVMRVVAREAFDAWNNDQDSRTGKLLIALSGSRGIRLDLDAPRDAQEKIAHAE